MLNVWRASRPNVICGDREIECHQIGFFNRVNINLSHIWFHHREVCTKRKHRPIGCFGLFFGFFFYPFPQIQHDNQERNETSCSGPQLWSTNEIKWMCQQALPQGAASQRSVRETMRPFPHGISQQRWGTIPEQFHPRYAEGLRAQECGAKQITHCRWAVGHAQCFWPMWHFFFLQPCTEDNDSKQRRQQRLAASQSALNIHSETFRRPHLSFLQKHTHIDQKIKFRPFFYYNRKKKWQG